MAVADWRIPIRRCRTAIHDLQTPIRRSRIAIRARWTPESFSTPTGLRPLATAGPQPRWGCGFVDRFPRVARASQPWAGGRNPVGILRWNCRKTFPLARIFHPGICTACFPARGFAGFQIHSASRQADALPTGKSATPQVWKPALPARRATNAAGISAPGAGWEPARRNFSPKTPRGRRAWRLRLW